MAKKTPTHSFPIRMPEDLLDEINGASEFTSLSAQDVARLALRIGLAELRATKSIANAVQKYAAEKGLSFEAWAKQMLKQIELDKAGTGEAPPSRSPDPEPPSPPPRRDVRYSAGTEGLGIRSTNLLNEDPPPNPLPEVGSQDWIDAKAALKKLAGQAKK